MLIGSTETAGQTLQGKVAVVSGSSSGIGAEIGRELASRGAHVVLNYPFLSLGEAADKLAAGFVTDSIAVEADMSTTDGPKRLVDAAVKQFGKIDILVNNAALAVNKPFEEQTLDDWDLLVNLNGRGTFLLTQNTLAHLPKQGSRIVNIVSISAREAPAMQTIYAGSKGMVDSFTKVWAKELPPKYGCTVNAVSPGPTMTEGFAQAGEAFMAEMRPVIEKTPVGSRLGSTAEIAYAVAFLCEPRASWINGAHLMANGGLYID
ncbi:NAD(P)-binding protein [Lophiostoma macrostomum CBS 122681]|uniref:NAD(P)-binding protein n=1 Tax=Lophiostoma macrostomum CBS 122681 TaxID=1314788 RepID=A0A6A6SLQ0_9PLEO|nr:NAD(P)-binding protein [Lophiostoma macrostomum CBS 122681]